MKSLNEIYNVTEKKKKKKPSMFSNPDAYLVLFLMTTILLLFLSIIYDATRDTVYDINIVTEIHTCVNDRCLITVDDQYEAEVRFPVRVGSEIVSYCKVKRGGLRSCNDFAYSTSVDRIPDCYTHVDDYHIKFDLRDR